MANSNKNHSGGFLSNALGVAKKLTNVGLDLVGQVSSNGVSKQDAVLDHSKTVEGTSRQQRIFEANQHDNPQEMLRKHVPLVTQQLLGRRYNSINKVVSFVSPEFSDKVSDYFFDRLNTFTNNMSSVDSVLDQAGIKDLEELTQDIDRSKRLSQALAEQNKWIASLQGALTGATGVIGSSIDIPASIILSLRTIYQVGRSYGFDLNNKEDQDIVQYIFKQINLGILAEKHTLLMGLKTVSNMLQVHDVQQLQQLLGSSNDLDALKKWFTNEQGEMKWEWLNHIPNFSSLTKMSPVIGATISATYSWKLVEDVNEKAQEVFSNARQYLIHHKESSLSVISAYEKSLQLIAQASPKLLNHVKIENNELEFDQVLESNNPSISEIKIQKKDENVESKSRDTSDEIKTIENLAEKVVEPHLEVASQQSALKVKNSDESEGDALNVVYEDASKRLESVKKKPIKRVTKKTQSNTTNK